MMFQSMSPPPENVQTTPTGFGSEVYFYDTDGSLRHYPPRTKMSHPYCYDQIVLIDTGKAPSSSAYSDRMSKWDYEAFTEALGGVGEMSFNWGSKAAAEKFLCTYYKRATGTFEITKVTEVCNASNGYPVWFIRWRVTADFTDGEVGFNDLVLSATPQTSTRSTGEVVADQRKG